MEYIINPHFKIDHYPIYFDKPYDCRYYIGGQCIGIERVDPCEGKTCMKYQNRTKPPIITLCGSTKFKNLFLEAARDLTFQGWIVLMPGVFGHADDIDWSFSEKKNLDELHREKIRMSNAIFVLNYEGYIGDSTKSEIEFAKYLNMPIYYYE